MSFLKVNFLWNSKMCSNARHNFVSEEINVHSGKVRLLQKKIQNITKKWEIQSQSQCICTFQANKKSVYPL